MKENESFKTMNETFGNCYFVVLGYQDPRAQTGSNETPSLRQTKYCQTERLLYEIVSVKKQNRCYSRQAITYFLLVTVKI